MIWPPSKAISIRTRSPSATQNHLRQDPVNGIGVDESNFEPEQALAWLLVDQIGSRAGELGESCVQIAHLVGDVVHAGASFGKKATDRCVLPERLEQFHSAVAE